MRSTWGPRSLGEGIGELEGLASQGKDEHCLIPSWASFIADTLNKHHMAPNSRVAEVYWSVSNASIRGLLVRIRTALAELVAELITLTPQDQEVPDKLAADQAVQFVITGDRATIHYSSQHAADGGTNVMVGGGSAPGPVIVSGANGSTIGSQTASGANSSVVGSQAANGTDSRMVGGQVVQAGHDAVAAGQDATITSAADQSVKEGWWARLRKRGVVVAFAIIIGAIAAVVGTVDEEQDRAAEDGEALLRETDLINRAGETMRRHANLINQGAEVMRCPEVFGQVDEAMRLQIQQVGQFVRDNNPLILQIQQVAQIIRDNTALRCQVEPIVQAAERFARPGSWPVPPFEQRLVSVVDAALREVTPLRPGRSPANRLTDYNARDCRHRHGHGQPSIPRGDRRPPPGAGRWRIPPAARSNGASGRSSPWCSWRLRRGGCWSCRNTIGLPWITA